MIRLLLVLAAVAGLMMAFAQSMSRVSNCGGNSAAMAQVRSIYQLACSEVAEAPDHTFQFTKASKPAQEYLRPLGRNFWIRKARFLVPKGRISEKEDEAPSLVAVCDTPYKNVPERRFWESPPTHAAVYSDGSTRLLTVDEFAALPKGDFVALDELFPPRAAEH